MGVAFAALDMIIVIKNADAKTLYPIAVSGGLR
jgi:hypothetical protein